MSINYNNNNTIIFTLARMNPPTPGHLFLIQNLIEHAIIKNVDHVYIILSKTIDSKENPIPCNEKINVLGNWDDMTKTMIRSLKELMKANAADNEYRLKIENVKVNTICVPEVKGATPFTPLTHLIENMGAVPDINLFLVVGDDRISLIDCIKKCFSKRKNVRSIDGMPLPRQDMGEFKQITSNPERLKGVDMSKVPVNMISASSVRNIVKYGTYKQFFDLYSPYLDADKIKVLHEMIAKGMGLSSDTTEDVSISEKNGGKNGGKNKNKKQKHKSIRRKKIKSKRHRKSIRAIR